MDALPDTIDALRAALIEARGRAALAEADAAQARAERSGDQALIATLKLQIEKLQRDLYGRRSERTSRLLGQLEFQLEEAQASVGEDDLAAEQVAEATGAARITRKAPSRKPFPAHLPRERVVIPAPAVCPCCGSTRLCKLGESVTETAERIPARWKIIQTVREKFSCRDCETISQPPAPFHTTPRGWAGPNLLATLLFEKFGQHQPLNRQCERFAKEGMEISLSTAADQVGAACGVLKPLLDRLAAHVLAAERLHGEPEGPAKLRHDRAGAGEGQDRHRPHLGLCARRSPLRGRGGTGGAVPLLPRPWRRASRGTSGRLGRSAAGRRLCRIQPPLRREPPAGARGRGPVLGARASEILRTRRYRRQQAARQGGAPDFSAGAGGGAAHRPAVRHRARSPRALGSRPSGGAHRAVQAPGRGTGKLDANGPGRDVEARAGGQGDGLHADPLGRLHPLPA
ncbi:transposase (plasmid) [Azospirillum sp. B510]|nr:transposase [Azospirillum sp. B510]BAI74793.1 transposase [Azospirillum sp. B510]BAI74852.1 transposase [Azospirillum sp. B510]BAI75688.1 transposase [Azospirillum sp. B510]